MILLRISHQNKVFPEILMIIKYKNLSIQQEGNN